MTPNRNQESTILMNRFAGHVLRALYANGPQTKTELVSGMPQSAKTLHSTVDSLMEHRFITRRDRVFELTDDGRRAAELFCGLYDLEQSHREEAIDVPALEEAVTRTISEFVGRPFPSNMSIRVLLGYIVRDAYPDREYTGAERRPYTVSITEEQSKTKPVYGSSREDIIEEFLDASNDTRAIWDDARKNWEETKGSIPVLLGDEGKRKVWQRVDDTP